MNRNCTFYFLLSCTLLHNGQKGCYESLGAGWVRCPQEDHYKNTLGYKSPGSQEQTLEMKDKDEAAQIKNEKKTKQGILMIRVRRRSRGGETRFKRAV